MGQRDNTTGRVRTVVALLVLPVLLYPCFYLSALACDTFLGERDIVHRLSRISKREVWDFFWADWFASLPFAWLACVPVLAALKWLSDRRDVRWPAPFVLAAAAVAVSFAFLGGDYLAITVVTALIFSIPVSGVLSRC